MHVTLSPLARYEQELIQKAKSIFTDQFDGLYKIELPQLKWEMESQAPCALQLYLLCSKVQERDFPPFFEEMVQHWLAGRQKIDILSSQHVAFGSFFYIELLVHVKNDQQLTSIQKQLPEFLRQIKRGSLSHLFAKQLLQTKRLSLNEKSSAIYQTAAFLTGRFPKRFEADFYYYLEQFLLKMPEGFVSKRSVHHLCRLISAQYLFEKALKQSTKTAPFRRSLHLKLLPTQLRYPFGYKKVLALIVSLNGLGEYELFSHRHLLKTLGSFFPLIMSAKNSFSTHQDQENQIQTLYLELENKDGSAFTLQQMQEIKRRLTLEIKYSIEYLSPSLFIPRNEEEMLRNIITLSNELKYVRDLPQAIISFQEQRKDILMFNIVLVRVKNKQTVAIQESTQQLPSQVRFIFERVTHVGMIRKKQIKEACVFSLEVKNGHFLRKNHSIDLVKARQYIHTALKRMIGEFRDFNGGFLIKQNEQIEAIKETISNYNKQHDFLFENLFYSLCPSIILPSLPKDRGELLFTLFIRLYYQNLCKGEPCLIDFSQDQNSLVLVIKTDQRSIKQDISECMQKFNFSDTQLACSSFEIEEHHYLCYILVNSMPKTCAHIVQLVQKTVDKWKKKQENLQVLRLHIPRAIRALDPRIAVDRTSGVVMNMLYEGLMREDIDKKLEPGIAENVSISPDGMRYTFHLRECFWSNGTLLTAHDFVYAWKSILDPQFFAAYSFLFFVIKNAQKAKKGLVSLDEVGVFAENDHTLVVDLEFPASFFLQLTAIWIFSPLWNQIDKKQPAWAYCSSNTHIGNGPFQLKHGSGNNEIHVIKNPYYWDFNQVKLDEIKIKIFEDEQLALDLFSRGELDWMGDPLSKIPLKKISHLQGKGEIKIDPSDGFFWLQLDTQSIPFHNVKLRKAFAYAIDRFHLVTNVLKSNCPTACSFWSGLEDLVPRFKDGDRQQALLLFKEGLQESGLLQNGLPPIRITHSEIEEHEAISHAIGRMWKDLFNVQIEYERILWNTYFDALNRGDYQVGGLVWYRRHSDPLYFFDLFLEREHAVKVTNWKNQEFISLVQRAKKSMCPKKQKELLLEAEIILLDEMPLIPICLQTNRYMANPRLKNIVISNSNLINFRTAYLTTPNEET